MKVLVLLGGNSPEREVSLRSGKAVAEALRGNGHQVVEYDPADGYEGLNRFRGAIDCVFPILHGEGGEDGEAQEQLEKLDFKFLGADSKVSKLCFDKEEFKKLLDKLSILSPRYEIVNPDSLASSDLLKKPYVLKPIDGGSSIDTLIIRDLSQKIDMSIFDRHPNMLLEELIEGSEITVPVLGEKALPVIEIIPPEGGEFDYENKYNGATKELCPPEHISEENQLKAQDIAEQVHNAAGVRHLSRTDIMIDNNNQHWVLELNTMPGMTSQSLYPKSAAHAGIDMRQLVEQFLNMTTGAKH
ncbi:D-alanine--D-alanine ligase [Candidatus Saccharibacteria bacterium]|jgi:D-alanine-D-alanine ligase|nr:D-alanine--D-alanine ligase [Candidatus Saccharibacteria bacterium]